VPDPPMAGPDDTVEGSAVEGSDADDYRHRMTMNIAAAAVLTLLMAFGLWLAEQMAENRHAQECLAMGARGACAAIPVPPRER
jgi:hypothetical protein